MSTKKKDLDSKKKRKRVVVESESDGDDSDEDLEEVCGFKTFTFPGKHPKMRKLNLYIYKSWYRISY